MKGVTERNDTTSMVSVSNADNVQQFEEQREKFKKEARRLRKLKNEHIVKVHDLFEENGTAYYVMDFIDGESLAEKMKKTGQPFTEAEVRSILSQILEALKEVHQNEIWHLDLKPGNIMIDKSGNAYLIDFGASKQLRANGSITTSTALCYTPGYAPNEQIGQMYDRFGPWTDIYALGATVYNLLTNKKPPMAIDIEEDEEDAYEFPIGVCDDMRNLVVWMMQPQRKMRPQSIDEIMNMIVSFHSTTMQQEVMVCDNDKLTIIEEHVFSHPQDESTALSSKLMEVGTFIYVDGSFSKYKVQDKDILGVIFKYYNNSHGLIMSPFKDDRNIEINGEKLNWRSASLQDWIAILNNLCNIKVEQGLGKYLKIISNARPKLVEYNITEPLYGSVDQQDGVSYCVNLGDCCFVPYTNPMGYPEIYVAEF